MLLILLSGQVLYNWVYGFGFSGCRLTPSLANTGLPAVQGIPFVHTLHFIQKNMIHCKRYGSMVLLLELLLELLLALLLLLLLYVLIT